MAQGATEEDSDTLGKEQAAVCVIVTLEILVALFWVSMPTAEFQKHWKNPSFSAQWVSNNVHSRIPGGVKHTNGLNFQSAWFPRSGLRPWMFTSNTAPCDSAAATGPGATHFPHSSTSVSHFHAVPVTITVSPHHLTPQCPCPGLP